MTAVAQVPPVEVFLNSTYGVHQGDSYFNDVSFQLQRPIIAPPGYSLYLTCLSATIPVSWTVLNQSNNSLLIDDTLFVLESGNYSAAFLNSELKRLLNGYLTVEYNFATLKFTLTSPQPVTISGGLCAILGITENEVGSVFHTKNTIDLSGVNSIYVLTDFVGNNVDTRPGQCASVLCRIPVTAPPLGCVQYFDNNGVGSAGLLIQDSSLSSIRIRLEDEYRLPLNASIFWELTLQIQFVFTNRQTMQVERPLGLNAPSGNYFM
jgi:hypothetical protein